MQSTERSTLPFKAIHQKKEVIDKCCVDKPLSEQPAVSRIRVLGKMFPLLAPLVVVVALAICAEDPRDPQRVLEAEGIHPHP